MFTKILLPVDMSHEQHSQRALDAAIFQAKASNASIHLMTVIPGFSMPMVSTYLPRDILVKAHEEVKNKLRKFAEEHIPNDISRTIQVADGTAYKKILKEAARIGADLLIMANHDSNKLDKFFLGSVTSKIAEHCKIDLMIIKD